MADEWDLETDIVVVGGGGCGWMAAFAAAKTGAEVLLLDKDADRAEYKSRLKLYEAGKPYRENLP